MSMEHEELVKCSQCGHAVREDYRKRIDLRYVVKKIQDAELYEKGIDEGDWVSLDKDNHLYKDV